MEQLVKELEAKMAEFAKNANDQVEKGNKAAGTRARKASLEIEKLMKQFRKESIEAAK
jgi:outer membrane murein-binding lipoprotein Lpp